MCRHGCFEIQIIDLGQEFVNEVCKELYELTGVEQRVTSCLIKSVKRISRMSKPNNKELFGNDFGR